MAGRDGWALPVVLATLAVLAVLATCPVLDMAVSDDSSYYYTTLTLARTGRFEYNGWATAMLGAQMYYGALIVKLFGFSFTGLRIAMLPFAAGSAVLLNAVSRRAGLSRESSALMTLTVVLSPIFLPVAASYMTDVSGFFLFIAAVWLCLKALDRSRAGWGAIAWLSAAAVVSVVGATVRQPVFLVAVIGVTYVAWRRRGDRDGRLILVSAGTLVVLSATVTALFDRWFGQQPWAIHPTVDEMLRTGFGPQAFGREDVEKVVSGITTAALVMLPVTLFTLPRVWRQIVAGPAAGPAAFLRVGAPYLFAVLIAAALAHVKKDAWPYWSDVFSYRDFWELMDYLGPEPPVPVLPVALRGIVLVGVASTAVLTALLGLASAKSLLRRGRRPVAPSSPRPPDSANVPAGEASALLTLLFVGYLVLLAIRWKMPGSGLLDRYWILAMPSLGVPALRAYARVAGPRPPAAAWATLAAFAVYGILAVHDHFAIGRARLAAVQMLRADGTPPEQIYVNFPFNSWIEFERVGHINEKRVTNPPGAFIDMTHPAVPGDLWCWWDPEMRSQDPRWAVLVGRLPFLQDTAYPPIAAKTWLPPYGRQVVIQRMPSAPTARQSAGSGDD